MDTDILSAIMRRNPLVLARARFYLSEHGRFTISLITRYEILRGLKARAAEKQVLSFDSFCSKNTILPLTDAAVAEAAEIYADLSSRGVLIPGRGYPDCGFSKDPRAGSGHEQRRAFQQNTRTPRGELAEESEALTPLPLPGICVFHFHFALEQAGPLRAPRPLLSIAPA